MKHLRKWLLCVIAAFSLTVTACQGDAATNGSVAADVAHVAGNILGSIAEAAGNSGAGSSSGQGRTGGIIAHEKFGRFWTIDRAILIAWKAAQG